MTEDWPTVAGHQAPVPFAPPPPQAAPKPRRPRARPEGMAQLDAALPEAARAVLGSLSALHVLTSRQLDRLHFQEDHTVTPLAATRRAHRCLARLHQLGVVDRLDRRVGGPRAGSTAYIWRLSPAGARLVGLPAQRRRPEPGYHHIAHTLDVAEVVVRLHEHARHNRVAVSSIETEPGCWRRYTDPAGRPRWLKPDLRLTLRTARAELHWFVEVDRGHERTGAITHKATAYAHAWRDGTEAARAGVYPCVLWVVPDQGRAALVAANCSAFPAAPAGLFATATRADAIDTLTETPT